MFRKHYLSHSNYEKQDRFYHVSMNDAMIIQYAQSQYGISLTNEQADQILNESGGGNPEQVDQVLQNNPQVIQNNLLSSAQQLQNFQVQANQPAIQTLESQYNPSTGTGALTQAYGSLLQSITGEEQPAINQTTLGAAQSLASRGILPSSALYQQTVGSALQPVSAQFANLTAQTGLGETQDLAAVAGSIAALQSGNPTASITGAQNLIGLQQAAQTIPSTIQQQTSAAQFSQAQAAEAQTAAKYIPTTQGASLFNTSSGQYTNPLLSFLTGGLP